MRPKSFRVITYCSLLLIFHIQPVNKSHWLDFYNKSRMYLLLFMPPVTLVQVTIIPCLKNYKVSCLHVLLMPLSVSLQCKSQSDPGKHNSEHLTTPFKPAYKIGHPVTFLTLSINFPLALFQSLWLPCSSLNTWACSCLRAFALALQECFSATYLHGKLLLLPLLKSHLLSKAVYLHCKTAKPSPTLSIPFPCFIFCGH